jgi:hypothetical protein
LAQILAPSAQTVSTESCGSHQHIC